MPIKKPTFNLEIIGRDKETGHPFTRKDLQQEEEQQKKLLQAGFTPSPDLGDIDYGPAGETELRPTKGIKRTSGEMTAPLTPPRGQLAIERETTSPIIDPLARISGDEYMEASPDKSKSDDQHRWEEMTGQGEAAVAKRLEEITGDEEDEITPTELADEEDDFLKPEDIEELPDEENK